MTRAWVLALAVLVASGCPSETKSPSPEAAANAQRTLDALRGQAQRRFDELVALPRVGEGRVAAETGAIKGIKIWLTQRRQWRAEGYRIRLAPAKSGDTAKTAPPEQGQEKGLDKAGLEALIAAGKPVALVLSIPELDPTPSGTREFQDPKALAPLVDLLKD